MIRKLGFITVGGFIIAAACLGLARALGPFGWDSNGAHFNFSDDTAPGSRVSGNGPIITRTLPWQAGDAITLNVPARITYTQSPTASFSVRGPTGAVNDLKLDNDELSFGHTVDLNGTLDITITAPSVTDFTLNGAQVLTINNYNADDLSLSVSGAGKITAQGRAKSVSVDIAGAADANLAALTTDDAKINISGLGNVTAGPTQNADVTIDGAGNVTLTRHPAHLKDDIQGAGHISQPKSEP